MVDAVDTLVLHSGSRRYAARFTNISDSTGEAAVIKIDLSTLIGPDGTAPTRFVVEELEWNIQGFTSVALYWDHTTDDIIDVLAGVGYKDYRPVGGAVDPASAGGTGDVVLTTAGASATATYDITIVGRLKD